MVKKQHARYGSTNTTAQPIDVEQAIEIIKIFPVNGETSAEPEKPERARRNIIPVDDGSEGSDYEDFGLVQKEDMVKVNFIDEFDLFRYYFKCIKKTRQILPIIDGVKSLNDMEPCELWRLDKRPFNERKFIPFPPTGGAHADMPTVSKKIRLKTKGEEKNFEAVQSIGAGEVLLIEKAVAVTNEPNTQNRMYTLYRCHNCMRVVIFFFSCDACKLVVYCSRECRMSAWCEFHQFECFGLHRTFFNLQEAYYMAMRLMFYGARFGFGFDDEPVDPCTGPKEHNRYKDVCDIPYKLKSKSVEELTNILDKCSKILVYLIEHTKFFKYLCFKYPKYLEMRLYDVYMLVGGYLVRHYIQAEESIICMSHFRHTDCMFSDEVDFISTAIFPTMRFFKDGCSPNSICCFRENYIIVKARQAIPVGEEIQLEWIFRNRDNCSCEHCLGRLRVSCTRNAFKCRKCQGVFLPVNVDDNPRLFLPGELLKMDILEHTFAIWKCTRCNVKLDFDHYKSVEQLARSCITYFNKTGNIKFWIKAYQHYKKILQPTHTHFSNFAKVLIDHYFSTGPSRITETIREIEYHLSLISTHCGDDSFPLLCWTSTYTIRFINLCKTFNYYEPEVLLFIVKLITETKMLAAYYFIEHKLDYQCHLLEFICEKFQTAITAPSRGSRKFKKLKKEIESIKDARAKKGIEAVKKRNKKQD